MHSLKGYDGRLAIKNAYKIMQNLDNSTNIAAIPSNYENIMRITIGDVKVIASIHLMKSSLEKLAENLHGKDDACKNFKHMQRFYGDKVDLLCQKGNYPYEPNRSTTSSRI